MLVASFGAAYTSGMVLANFDWLAWIFLMSPLLAFHPQVSGQQYLDHA